jgi:hypothetical protein
MFLKLSLFLCLPLCAQIHVSFSQQGAETLRTISGGLIKSVGVGSANICSLTPTDQVRNAALIYDAARSIKISTISPLLAGPILDRAKARSRVQVIEDVGGIVLGTAGVLGTTRVIPNMPRGGATALTLAPLAIGLMDQFLAKRLPKDDVVRGNMLQGQVGIRGGDCEERFFLFLYHGPWDPVEATLLVTPLKAELSDEEKKQLVAMVQAVQF